MRFQNAIALLLLVSALAADVCQGQLKNIVPEKGVIAQNDQSVFSVAIAVNHANRQYREGEKLSITFQSERAGYCYVLNRNTKGERFIIFPNSGQPENKVPADTIIRIPDGISFVARPPFGTEQLEIVVAPNPIQILEDLNPREKLGTPIPDARDGARGERQFIKAINKELTEQSKDDGQWAEGSITLTTYPKNEPPTQTAQNWLLAVGINEFKDAAISPLACCVLDATNMTETLQRFANVPADNSIVLLGKQATRKAILDAFDTLAAASRPGDKVFIFMATHGGRCADTNGDDPDGIDEFLVPYDAKLSDPENSTILDDTFARYMLNFDARELVIMLDCCHSGGAAKSAEVGKTSSRSVGTWGKVRATGKRYDSLGDELRRKHAASRELNRDNVVVLAAAAPEQLCWERQDGTGGVFTVELTAKIVDDSTDANDDGKITTTELFNAVEDPTRERVKSERKSEQDPQRHGDREIVIRTLAE